MCGIVAIYSPQEPVSAEALEVATRRLHHRGPDGQRTWIAPHQHVGLGHARLSIIDLVTGDQPLASEEGELHLVVNGEFYGYRQIRRELEARGHQLATKSDSEIALHLYQEQGASCLRHLRGEFAMVLWDEPNGQLLAARDRFGIKPLYYARLGDRLYLASEIKALLAAGVPARWDQESMYQVLHVYFDQDRTLFEGIYQVPPGCYLLATRNQLQIVRYWDFNYPRADEIDLSRPDEEHIERMRAELDEAVRVRMVADVPVGCYLSGGIDSCALLGLASRHHAEPIEAFTLCFDTQAYNEEAVASEMARHAGANYHPLAVRQAELADHFFDCIWHSETLTANPHGVAKFLLSRFVRDQGYKVVFTGEGSDEILGGYAHFRRDMLLYNSGQRDPQEVQRLLSRLEEENEVSRGTLLPTGNAVAGEMENLRRTLGFAPSWLETRSANSARYRPLMKESFAREFAARDPFRVFLNRLDVLEQLAGRDPVNQSLYLWTRSMLPNYLLNMLGDRMEMAHSIEGRVPFLDHHVVEAVRDMPVTMKIRDMTEKYVLREAVRPVLTETVYQRQKHPFLAPPSGLDPAGRFSQMMSDVLRGSALDSLPFFDKAKVVYLLDKLPTVDDRKRVGISSLLTMILSACVLHERYHMSC